MRLAFALSALAVLPPPTNAYVHPGTPAMRMPRARRAAVTRMDEEFTQNQLLREEIEAPFAKFRSFLWPAAFGAAALATYFGATSLLAEMASMRPAAGDTLPNLAIDLAALGGTAFFWRRDGQAREARLQRIKSAGRYAALRVRLLGEAATACTLADLRASRNARYAPRRVIIVAAEEAALAASLAATWPLAGQLVDADFLVVPLVLAPPASGSGGLPAVALPEASMLSGASGTVDHLGLAMGTEEWQGALEQELRTALSQADDAATRGITLVFKKNGRVGTRRLGTPEWAGLVGDVRAREASGLDVANI